MAENFTLDVVLVSYAQRNGGQKTETLSCAELPRTVTGLKEQIEKEFRIPAYDQLVKFGPAILGDQDTLAFHRIVSGDTLVVEYSCAVDIERINELNGQLQKIASFLQSASGELAKEHHKPDFLQRISRIIRVSDLKRCIDHLLSVSVEERAANSKFFIHAGGLRLLNQISNVLLKQSWNKICHYDLLLCEKAILSLMAYISLRTPNAQRYEIFHESIQNIVGSFLRVPVCPAKPIIPPQNKHLSSVRVNDQLAVLLDVMWKALKILVPLCETSQFQVQLTSMPRILDQLEGFLLSPSLLQHQRNDVICCLENLGYNPDVHCHIAKPSLVLALIKSSDMPYAPIQRANMDPGLYKKLECEISRFFSSLTISQLTLMNKVVLNVPEAVSFVASVVNDIDHQQLSQFAITAHGYQWGDLLPYMKLAYSIQNLQLSSFHLNCFEVMILALRIALSSDKERKVLVKQGLLDYLICLPWHLPCGSKARLKAQSVVDLVGSNMQLQPPTLMVIVKSKLAVMHYGLEKVLKSDCYMLIDEVLG